MEMDRLACCGGAVDAGEDDVGRSGFCQTRWAAVGAMQNDEMAVGPLRTIPRELKKYIFSRAPTYGSNGKTSISQSMEFFLRIQINQSVNQSHELSMNIQLN